MINFEYENNKLTINENNVQLNNSIKNVVAFNDMIIVMLMDERIPKNNIIAFDKYGNKIWDISNIIILPQPEVYVSLSRINENTIKVISYFGIETYIDIRNQCIISQVFVK